MSNSRSEIDQFLMLEFLRHQLDEVFEATNTDLISPLLKRLKDAQVAPGESRTFDRRLTIMNIGNAAGSPKYVVEELSRLSSAVLALSNTIEHMRASIRVVEDE